MKKEIEGLCVELMEKEQEIQKLIREKREAGELLQFEQEEMKELMKHCEEVEADVTKLDLIIGEKKTEIEILDKHNEILVDKLMELGYGVEIQENGDLQFVRFE